MLPPIQFNSQLLNVKFSAQTHGGIRLQNFDFINWFIKALQNPLGQFVLLPIGYALFRFAEYLVKRKVEGKDTSEKIDQYSKLLDLKEKLVKNKVTIKELQSLRTEMFENDIDKALIISTQFNEKAKLLIRNIDNINGENKNENSSFINEPHLTQIDMNLISHQKVKDAEEYLKDIIGRLTQDLSYKNIEALNTSQVSWMKFRDDEVSRETLKWEGGSILPLMKNVRLEVLTRERIASLENEYYEQGNLLVPEMTKPTPTNLFQYIEVGLTKNKAEAFLGEPYKIESDTWYYNYKETQLQISFDEEKAISQVMLLLRHGHIVYCADAITSIPLGQLTFQDLIDNESSTVIAHEATMRTETLYSWQRIGPAGAWDNYCFGTTTIFSGIGQLEDVSFEWDCNQDVLVSPPKDIKINWVGKSRTTIDYPFFNYFIS